jgi:hypothetical protein
VSFVKILLTGIENSVLLIASLIEVPSPPEIISTLLN